MAYLSVATGGPVQPLRPVREAPTQTGEWSGCAQPPNQGNLFSSLHEKGMGQEDVKPTSIQSLSGKKCFPGCAQEHHLPIISQIAEAGTGLGAR